MLGYLVQNPGAIQRDIAQISRTSAASVSSLLQGLERRGLVERRTEDGDERSKRVYATPAGAELIAGFDTAMAAADETILAPLDQRRAGHPARPAHEDHRGAAATDPLVTASRAARPRIQPSPRRAGVRRRALEPARTRPEGAVMSTTNPEAPADGRRRRHQPLVPLGRADRPRPRAPLRADGRRDDRRRRLQRHQRRLHRLAPRHRAARRDHVRRAAARPGHGGRRRVRRRRRRARSRGCSARPSTSRRRPARSSTSRRSPSGAR